MIYLDHAANAPIHPEVLDAMLPWMSPDHVGNPSSLHTQGLNARHAIAYARSQVAELIGARPSEIYFTSGGTESNNTWIQCADGFRILASSLEHHSVTSPIENNHRFSLYTISSEPSGCVDMNDLEEHLTREHGTVGAVSVIWVNNEIGTINPIEEIGELCKKHGVLFHTDAVQAVGHVPVDVHQCNVDFLSLSGHKFGAPQGIGALYISNKVKRKIPLISGGGQEFGMRSGTQNVPGIVGLGKAAEIASKQLPIWQKKWRALRYHFLDALHSYLDDPFQVNGGSPIADHIISLTIPGIYGESLLRMLDAKGICLSAGSACSANDDGPSHVLTGIGLTKDLALSTIRISMRTDTTIEELDETASSIGASVRKLKKLLNSDVKD